MAFLDLIPLVGATIGGAIIAIVCAIVDFPTDLIVWAAFFLVYQQVENNVLQPFIYKRTVSLHPLLVLVAVLIGGSQLGVLGALLSIPVAAAAQILVKDWWHFRNRSDAASPPEQAGQPPTQLGPDAAPA
jgi:predicted PurR-regulated permease PerM